MKPAGYIWQKWIFLITFIPRVNGPNVRHVAGPLKCSKRILVLYEQLVQMGKKTEKKLSIVEKKLHFLHFSRTCRPEIVCDSARRYPGTRPGEGGCMGKQTRGFSR